ncbi:hypothetical protein BJF79_12590 [Actinomadura sp. CNU-125]|nr:hypothetical protein BJF79_12590 [Actinomadura sp. CNU-125]
MRRATVLVSGLALAAGGTTITATAAWAGEDESITTERGRVAWVSYGDKVYVSDTKKDGISIVGYYKGQAGIEHDLRASGVGETVYKTYDQREGSPVYIQMCYRDGNVIIKCSQWQKGTA